MLPRQSVASDADFSTRSDVIGDGRVTCPSTVESVVYWTVRPWGSRSFCASDSGQSGIRKLALDRPTIQLVTGGRSVVMRSR